MLAVISLSVYYVFLWLKGFVVKAEKLNLPEEHYHFETDLIHNEYIQIIMIEDEHDKELTKLNEFWMENVYTKETCLYRAKSVPVIPSIDGAICCFYCKEQKGGVILQLLPYDFSGNTQSKQTKLVYLDYKTLHTTFVAEAGPFFLYNDAENIDLIKGFNKKEEVSMKIILS